MKRFIPAFLIFTFLFGACTRATPAPTPTSTSTPLPVVLVDKEHMTTAGLVYQIPAGNGFILDASGYDFGPSTPMSVQVVTGNFFYQMDWAENADKQSILVSELQPLLSAKPLSAFSAGQQLIVSIGSLTMQGRFKPIWVGVIDVK